MSHEKGPPDSPEAEARRRLEAQTDFGGPQLEPFKSPEAARAEVTEEDRQFVTGLFTIGLLNYSPEDLARNIAQHTATACQRAVEEATKPLADALARLIERYQTVVDTETESGAWKQATDALRDHAERTASQEGGKK